MTFGVYDKYGLNAQQMVLSISQFDIRVLNVFRIYKFHFRELGERREHLKLMFQTENKRASKFRRKIGRDMSPETYK